MAGLRQVSKQSCQNSLTIKLISKVIPSKLHQELTLQTSFPPPLTHQLCLDNSDCIKNNLTKNFFRYSLHKIGRCFGIDWKKSNQKLIIVNAVTPPPYSYIMNISFQIIDIEMDFSQLIFFLFYLYERVKKKNSWAKIMIFSWIIFEWMNEWKFSIFFRSLWIVYG